MYKNMEMMGVLALFISAIISGCATSEDDIDFHDESEFPSIREKEPIQSLLSDNIMSLEDFNPIVPKTYVADEKRKIADHELMETEGNVIRDEVTNSIGMKLVWIPAGEFDMGSAEGELDEKPVHRVRISKGFWMGQTEVTQEQYKAIMGGEPWSGEKYVQESDSNPAAYISWDNAVEFCRKLSQTEGKIYRLPTEAEWEYACRAGSETRFSFGNNDAYLSDYAWFEGNAWDVEQKYARQVGQKYPNAFDLYDMHGNACEWCSDWYDENYYSESHEVDPQGPSTGRFRVLRGGSWQFTSWRCRSAIRSRNLPNIKFMSFGFRVVVQDYQK